MAEATLAQQRAAELLEGLWNDPEIGAKIQKAAKDKYSDVKTIDDAVAPVLEPLRKQNEALAAELKSLREEREAEKKAAEERKAEAEKQSFQQQIEAARKNYSLTDEGFDKMVERMKATGNYTDPDAAAAWVASKNPPAAVKGPTFGPQSLNLYGSQKADENMAALHRDPQAYMDAQLSEFISDPDRYVRETFGQ